MSGRKIRGGAEPTVYPHEFDKIDNPLVLTSQLMKIRGKEEDAYYTNRIRASSLYKICLREKLLGYRHDVVGSRRNALAMQVTFDIGHAIHYWLQNTGDYYGNSRIGYWRCSACGWERFGRPPTKHCKNCGAHRQAIRYREVEIELSKPWLVSGHTDMILEIAKGMFRLADFKTINAKDYKRLKGPLGDHVIQVVTYLILLEYAGLPVKVDPDRAYLVYVSKGHSPKDLPIKTFNVKRTLPVEKYVLGLFEKWMKGLKDPNFLPDPVDECYNTNWECWNAKSCPVKKQCRHMARAA